MRRIQSAFRKANYDGKDEGVERVMASWALFTPAGNYNVVGIMAEETQESQGKPKRVQRRWKKEEEIAILDYLKKTLVKGLKIEKPSSNEYYQKLIKDKKLEYLKPVLIKNKVRNMHCNYKSAVKWLHETGQEIKERDGDESFQNAFKKRYPFFDEYQEIWGGKVLDIDVPCSTSSDVAGSQDLGVTVLDGSNVFHQLDVIPISVTPTPPCNGSRDESESGEKASTSDADEAHTPIPASVTAAGCKLLARRIRRRPWTGRARFEESLRQRLRYDNDRIAVQKERIANEKQRFTVEAELRREELEIRRLESENKIANEKQRFTVEAELRREEFEIRRLESENNKQIRLAEIELEKLKWEAELQRFRQNN